MEKNTLPNPNVHTIFLIELDWYVLKATNELLKILIDPLSKLDKKENSIIISNMYRSSALIDKSLKSIAEKHEFILGEILGAEQFKASDYPSEFIKKVENGSMAYLFNDFVERMELNDKTEKQFLSEEITRAYLLLLPCLDEIVNYQEHSLKEVKGLLNFKKKQLFSSVQHYTQEINRAKALIIPRVLTLMNTNFEEVINLFEYKILFLYLENIASDKSDKPILEDESLQDTVESLEKELRKLLNKVQESDLWFLGNYVFEEIGKAYGMKFDLQRNSSFQSMKEAKIYRNQLMNTFSNDKNENYLLFLAPLISNKDFDQSLKSQILEFRELYQTINKSLLELFYRYENFNIELLVAENFIDTHQDFLSFINKLNFKYDSRFDDINTSEKLDVNTCRTLNVVMTDNPSKDFFVSKVHQNGILHKNKVIRRNLVSVYKFQMKDIEGE